MSIATLATNSAFQTVVTKAIPLSYVALSRGLVTNRANGHRSISTVSQPRLMPNNQSPSTIKRPYSPISPTSAAFRNVSRQFSTDRHLDPYERFPRRTGVNWGIRVVPQYEAFVIERLGRFHKVLEAGLHVMVPFVDSISYIHSLKEQTIEIPEQPAVTADNVSIRVNGVLYVKVIDAQKASYVNDNVMYAVTQLAQTAMRSAIGKMSLDTAFKKRETLNANIVEAINDIASQWGLICARYEIKDIIPPPGIRDSMDMQAEAERRKRVKIIEAEGRAQALLLTAETEKMKSINLARGQAEAIKLVSESIKENGGQAAATLMLAQDYVQAFNDSSSMVYKKLIEDALGKNTFKERSKLNTFPKSSKLIDSATETIAQYKNLIGDELDEESSKLIDSATEIIALYKNFLGDLHDRNTKRIDTRKQMIALYKNLKRDEHDEDISKLIDSATQIIALSKNLKRDEHDEDTKLTDTATKIVVLYKNLIGDEHDEESSKAIDTVTQMIELYKNFIGDSHDKNTKAIDTATQMIALYKNLVGDAHDKNTFQESSELIDSSTQIIEPEVIDEKSSSSL